MIHIGIIGAGAIASVHIDSYLMFPSSCKVVAVCDAFLGKAESLIAEKGLDAKAYSSIDVLLATGQVDALSICLPPSLHAEVTVKALEAGKHVLCEKPMASSLEECDRMLKAAKESGKLLSIVSQNRFKTPVMKVFRLLQAHAAGNVRFSTFHSLWWRAGNYYDLDWRGTWKREGGGCFLNHSVHYLDIMHMFLGMPKSVRSFITNVDHTNSECEDLGVAVFQYGDGSVVDFVSSLLSHGEEQSISIQCDDASLEIPWKTYASKGLPNGFPEEDKDKETMIRKRYDELPSLPYEGHPAQIRDFLDAVEGKKSLFVDGNEGRMTIEIITGIYKSAVEEKEVTFPIAKDDPFYSKDSMVSRMPHFNEKTVNVSNEKASKISLGRNFGA